MTFQNLLTHLSAGIFTITVNRPDKLNALNRLTIQEIGQALKFAKENSEVRAVIITGAGQKSFVAGADISEFVNLTSEEGRTMAKAGQDVFQSIEDCPKPVVAAVNGFALGGGCELAMACHLRIASENAVFGQPEVKLGLIPGYGGTQRMVQYLGKAKALEYILNAENITAQQALQHGLVNYVTQQENLLPLCRQILEKILRWSPRAQAGVIASVNAFFTGQKNGFVREIEEFGKCFGTDDFKEGVSAFLEKRKPKFH